MLNYQRLTNLRNCPLKPKKNPTISKSKVKFRISLALKHQHLKFSVSKFNFCCRISNNYDIDNYIN